MSDKFIECEHCQAENKIGDLLQERSPRSNLIEVGLLCTCGIWTHSYFTSSELKAQALKNITLIEQYYTDKSEANWTRYVTARDAYKSKFDAHNRRWRRKFGMLE